MVLALKKCLVRFWTHRETHRGSGIKWDKSGQSGKRVQKMILEIRSEGYENKGI